MDSVYHMHSPAVQQQPQQPQQHQQPKNEHHQQHPPPQHQPHQPEQRSSQPVTMAPTAAMLDPNMGTHGKSTQSSPEFGSPQMQRFAAILNNHQHEMQPMMDQGSSRALPSIEVTDESLDNAYVDFILYCNPAIPTNVDTTELRKGFRSPPKSDGKSFSPFVLFGLISKLEGKEIKTWTQLVIELGVELPDPNKNQSSQKVQQYAVRLKVGVFAPSPAPWRIFSPQRVSAKQRLIYGHSVGFMLFTSTLSSITAWDFPTRTIRSDQ